MGALHQLCCTCAAARNDPLAAVIMQRKITYFTTGLALAGAETQVLRLCEKFVEEGWDTRVISLMRPEAYQAELQQLGIPLLSLNVQKRLPNPMAFLKLVRTLQEWNPDVLHCHQVHANLIGRLVRAFTTIPVLVCTAHSIQEGPRWREWAYRLTDPLCDLTTNVCQAGVDRYIKVGAVPEAKICYVPNAIDVNRFCAGADRRVQIRRSLGLHDEFLWLAVGNLREPKDYPNMLAAFQQVCTNRPDARLFIVGSGPLRAGLETLAKRNTHSNITFLGPREDVAQLMSGADAFVLSSAWEGTPLVLLEAGAASLPIVATSVGGVPEVVTNGLSGFLVQSQNPEALAEACLKVMNLTPDQRKMLGQAARNKIEAEFGLDSIVQKWKQIFARHQLQAEQRSPARGIV